MTPFREFCLLCVIGFLMITNFINNHRINRLSERVELLEELEQLLDRGGEIVSILPEDEDQDAGET